MSLTVVEIFHVLMRWVHITSVVVTVGGVAYARLVEAPSMQSIAEEDRSAMTTVVLARHRPLMYAGIVGLLISGLYNYFVSPGHTRYWHLWFGIKMLLVLHVFATAFLIVQPSASDPKHEAQRIRRMTSIFISGLIIILISAYLRRIF